MNVNAEVTSLMTFFPLELLGAILVYTWGLEKRKHLKARLLLAVLACVGLISGFLWLNQLMVFFFGTGISATAEIAPQTMSEEVISYSLACFYIFAVMTLGIYFVCDVKFNEAIFGATCAYLTEHVAYALRAIINAISLSDMASAGTPLYVFIHFACYLLAYFFIAREMINHKHYETSVLQSLTLLVSALFLVLIMSLIATNLNLVWFHSIYAIFSCFFVLYSQVGHLKELKIQKDFHFQEQMWMKHKAQYEMSKENIDIINRKSHDLKHQIAALKYLDSHEERSKAFESIEEAINIYDAIVETGSEIVDTVLSEKTLICRSRGITLNPIVDGKQLDFMDVIDLYTLLGNLIDNAIEAVQEIDRKEQRQITLIIEKKANIVFIQVENPYKGYLELKDGEFQTRKKDKHYHGFGLKSINHIAQKYDGIMQIETHHHIFLLRLSLPQTQA